MTIFLKKDSRVIYEKQAFSPNRFDRALPGARLISLWRSLEIYLAIQEAYRRIGENYRYSLTMEGFLSGDKSWRRAGTFTSAS
jgi:hypothetical protein